MNIQELPPTIKNPPEQFAGDVWLDLIAVPNGPDQRTTVGRVRFAPNARTAWHSHARGQYLHVTEGIAYFGSRDGTVLEVRPGQTLYTPPGEEHYHSAGPNCFMEHFAIQEAGDDPATSVIWLEHVSDADLALRGIG